jgi:hypothetical protein
MFHDNDASKTSKNTLVFITETLYTWTLNNWLNSWANLCLQNTLEFENNINLLTLLRVKFFFWHLEIVY